MVALVAFLTKFSPNKTKYEWSKRIMRFLLIFLLISTTAFAKDKIYTCKPVAAAVVLESGQTYSETLDTMDEEAALLSVVPTSQFLISK